MSDSYWIMIAGGAALYSLAKAIGGLGQLAGAAQYAHRSYTSGSAPNRQATTRYRPYMLRSPPPRRYRSRMRRSAFRKYRRYSKRMPMLRPRLYNRLQKTKYAPIGGVKKFKTVVLNHTVDAAFLDDLTAKKTENNIQFVDVLKLQWIPDRSDIPYDKTLAFESYEQCRLKGIIIELRNFNERRLVKYSDDRVEEKTPNKLLFRYLWDSNDMLGAKVPNNYSKNFNKLNKKKQIYKQSIKPSFTYKYIPKYHLNEGWCEFQNKDGYGSYDSLYAVYKEDFKALVNTICSKPVNRFKVNDGDTSALIDQPQFLPKFYFSHELEYSADQFDSKSQAFIQDVAVHLNFEINIKTIWEFKNPRIDPIV